MQYLPPSKKKKTACLILFADFLSSKASDEDAYSQ